MNKQKRHIIRILSLALLAGFMSVRATAQVSVSAHMFAQVIAALTATENSHLNFGKFSPETNGGEIHLSPEGVCTTTGSVRISGTGHSAGSFVLTGEDQATFSIALPMGQSMLTNSNGSNTMIVNGWESIPSSGIGAGVLNGGSQEVKVGATLVVGSVNDNPIGIYSGSYSITFMYN